MRKIKVLLLEFVGWSWAGDHPPRRTFSLLLWRIFLPLLRSA